MPRGLSSGSSEPSALPTAWVTHSLTHSLHLTVKRFLVLCEANLDENMEPRSCHRTLQAK